MQPWCSLAGKNVGRLVLGDHPLPRVGEKPLVFGSQPGWVWADCLYPVGLWCYWGDISGGDGVSPLPPPRRLLRRERSGPVPAAGTGRGAAPWSPTATRDRGAAPGARAGSVRLGAVAVAPRAGRCLSLQRTDGPGRAAGSLVTRGRSIPHNGAGTSSVAPHLPAAANRGRAGHPGLSPRFFPPLPVYPPPNTHFVVLQNP